MNVVAADLQAIYDVARLLTEQSDGLSAEQAISLMEEAKKAQQALRLAIDMLEAQALRGLEQPVLMGNVVYAKVPSMKKRPIVENIDAQVVRVAAQPDEHGELPSAFDVAQTAVELMKSLYVAPSSVPKVGGIKKIGLDYGDAITEEHTGFELKRTEIDG